MDYPNNIYDPDSFRKLGHKLVDQLADYLDQAQSEKIKVMNWQEPDDQFQYWKDYDYHNKSLPAFFEDLISRSIHLHHPGYIGHQVSAPAPITALTDMVTSLLNNGMAIYEMGPAASAIEKWVIQKMCKKIGFSEMADGFLTSGGTLATLTALLTARQIKGKSDIWKNGLKQDLAIMVPEIAHYCTDRAARIMGFGEDGLIKVPVDENFRLKTDLLDSYLTQASKNNKKVIAVVANACSTSTGTYDDLAEIGKFCQQNNLWFHIDAAHGGAAIFSDHFSHFMAGASEADSIIIDLHKTLLVPALATAVLYKDGSKSYQTYQQDAQYLWEENDESEWYNYAKRTFECTKLMMCVKFYSLYVEYGEQIFNQHVTILYQLARSFASIIKSKDSFELATEPMSNIVCFRKLSASNKYSNNQLNSMIRRELLYKGDFYIVQTELNGQVYLRTTIMNPMTKSDHFRTLLSEIDKIALLKG